MVEIVNGIISPEIKNELLRVSGLFWQALADRDIEKRFTFCADFVTFIGTGLNEKASNKEEYLEIGRKGKEQFPWKFQIEILWNRISVSNDIAWIENEVEWRMSINGIDSKELIRNTVILKMMEGRWLIIHVHGSIPDYKLSGQNYITNEETLKKNRELEGLVYQRTRDLDESLKTLKEMQAQLIQSEKMASLGELTAGIAHEIQNPLNFVNNFSEVNSELIDELQQELKAGKIDDAIEISKDIKDNEEKIKHHGKRADSIVKGMLQHSRISSGQKEPVDINNLADECLRLSFHGMRAKEKSFNAKTESSYDSSIPEINIISQDIGRVMLNLFTNAFYSVMQKKNSLRQSTNGEGRTVTYHYEPLVKVTTKRLDPPLSGGVGAKIEIRITDNGNGISQKILDKIFQPFFTTKPAGQGTGLGLSLSYDIMKAHRGELKVESKEGEFAEFTLVFPV